MAFPSGKHDDQVSALSMAVDVLSRQTITPEQIFGSLEAGNIMQQTHKKRDSLAEAYGRDIFKGWGEL